MPSSSSVDPDHGVASATDLGASTAVVPSRPRAGHGRHASPEDFDSILRRQHEVDALCKEHGVPKEFTASPAVALRANAKPPPGAICVYGRALQAGMRVPLHGFFCEALAHFSIAPAQLTPNGWNIMTGFLGLCLSDGVPPSLAVFRHFFQLYAVNQRQQKCWYYFQSRGSSGLRFTGAYDPFKDWKREFFFLSSPEPWPCLVKWGEPSKSSLEVPVLAGEEKKSAAELVRAHGHGGAAVDLRRYICNSNLAEAAMTATAFALLPPAPVPSSSIRITSSPEAMEPSVYDMMKTMLAEKAAAQPSASAKKVKADPGSKAPGSPPLRGKKRSLEECPPLSTLKRNTALSSGVCSTPPGFPRKPRHFLSRHNGDGTDRVATREQLNWEAKNELASAKRDAEQEKAQAELAATGAEVAKANAGLDAAEAEVVKAQAELTAAKRAAHGGREGTRAEVAMEGAKAKLAAAKRALEEELESAKSAAVHQLLCCEEHVRRRAERALDVYRRWRTGRAPAGCSAWLAR